MLTGWHGDGNFAECTTKKHTIKFLKVAKCPDENTRQSFSTLLSVKTKTLGKISRLYRVSSPKHSANFRNFAECHAQNTWQTSAQRPDFVVTLPSVY